MSAGSPSISLRLPQDLIDAVAVGVKKHNSQRNCRETIDMSEFVRKAIRQRLDHLRRASRGGKNKSKKRQAKVVDSNMTAFFGE